MLAALIVLVAVVYTSSIQSADAVARCPTPDSVICGTFELIELRGAAGYTGG